MKTILFKLNNVSFTRADLEILLGTHVPKCDLYKLLNKLDEGVIKSLGVEDCGIISYGRDSRENFTFDNIENIHIVELDEYLNKRKII